MLHCDRNQSHFLHSNMVDRCISIQGIGSKNVPQKHSVLREIWHLLLVTVANSEQDILHCDRIHFHFLYSNMVDRCISI